MFSRNKDKYKTSGERIFNGKKFKRKYHFTLKSKARAYAEEQRGKGFNVRIVGHTGVYTVYERKA